MLRVLPLLLTSLVLLTGCVDAAEEWHFDEHGGGTYLLSVRWNADLWRRVGGILGPAVMKRLAGRAFPLRKAQWADGLEGLDGVEVLSLEEADTDTGLRAISTRLKFRSVPDLLRWEVLARRTVRLGPPEPPAGTEARKDAICNFYMEPIARVPVLDRVAALLEAQDRPPPPAEGAGGEVDPGPLERLGLEREAAELVWRMARLPLAEARLSVRVRVRGRIVAVSGRRAQGSERDLTRTWDLAALRKPETDRALDVSWRPRDFDVPPAASNRGDERLPQGADAR